MTPRSLFIALLCIAPASAADEPSRPNVLFLAIDDLNDWVEPLDGHPLVKTPQMSRLAARGTTFTNAHCQSPLCNPSRTSLLTGLRPSTTGVYALNVWFRNDDRWKDVVTLPQYFMRHGYHVATTGKIFHDAYPPPKERKPGVEFTEWGPRGGPGKRPKRKFVDTPADHPAMDWGVFPERDEDCFDYDVASFAVDWLKKPPQDKPWMLCVGIRHPHVPCYAPQKWFDLYPDDDSILPAVKADDRDDVPPFAWYLHWKLPEPRLAWAKDADEWQPLVRSYLASVSFADAMVGRVADALDASGHADDTVVVLWSDHGWHLGEKGITGKNTLWDRSTRVPLIFAGPEIVAGAKCDQPAELLDLYPTLIELCGLPAQDGLEGRSLVPQLTDAATPREQPAITTHGPNNHGIRTDRWRYIRYADGSEELYDMQADPHEWTNLAGDDEHADVKQQLARWLPKGNAEPLGDGKVRLLEEKDGTYFWEGEPIGKNDPVPQ
ncbi:MAG: sulfatase [Planctomycetaceae bacterium]